MPSRPLDDPDRYAIQLLATALGGGMSSRLFSEVRERRGLAYYVYGLNHSYTDAGTLYSQAGVDIARIDDAVSTIAGELRKIAAEPLPARSSRRRATSRRAASSSTREPAGADAVRAAERGARAALPDPDEVLAGIDAVTSDDVARCVRADHGRSPAPRGDRPVRRRLALRVAARRLASGERTLGQARLLHPGDDPSAGNPSKTWHHKFAAAAIPHL